ncbi:MAG: hypothetical protein GWN56_12155 [Nitrosopumilaceae archaeon]|nr:hypothetical protein [Nitrosopumilaceae archaeon]
MAKRKNKRAYYLALFIFLAVLCLFLLRNKYLPYAGSFLVVENKLEKADAVFVFGGSVPKRIIEAAGIYKQGYAPIIIISRHPKPEGYKFLKEKGISFPEGHDINKSVALGLGIAEKNIIITKRRAASTFEELVLLNKLCLEKKYKKIILVSSKYHTKRISKIFSDISKGKVKGIIRYARYDSYDPKNWWKDRSSLRQTIFEYQKLLHHFLVDRGKIRN